MDRHATLPIWDTQTSEQKLDTLKCLVEDLYRYHFRSALTNLLAILDQYVPADAKEVVDLAEMKAMIATYPMILSPLCEVGHFTGSAIVMDWYTGHVLLHYHKSLKRWLQFGGHPDYETDLALVALREAQEESGLPDLRFFPAANPIDIDIHVIPSQKGRPEHKHLDIRYLLVTEHPTAFQKHDGESQEFRWVTSQAIHDQPDLLRLVQKAEAIYRKIKS